MCLMPYISGELMLRVCSVNTALCDLRYSTVVYALHLRVRHDAKLDTLRCTTSI
jgi:hypothetical protein